MPAPGDQHNALANPFEETRPHISEFTASEIATLQSRLEKQLGPEYISARSGPSGQKVHYIAAEKCIALANEVFGFNGWSSSIQNIQVDFVDENPQTLKISLGLSVIVRVTLKDGTYHEDIGYGHIENCKGKAAAFEKAKKEGTTDALKRTLRNFGNVLGNCIYDKDYLAKVTKMKVAPTKFDAENLHRHADFAKKEPEVKSEAKGDGDKGAAAAAALVNVSIDSLDEDFGDFDMADFGVTEDGHPDEVVLPAPHGVNATRPNPAAANHSSDSSRTSTNSAAGQPRPMQPPARGLTRSASAGQAPRQQPHTPVQPAHRPGPSFQGRGNPQQQGRNGQPNRGPQASTSAAPHAAANAVPNNAAVADSAALVSFFSARSVTQLPDDAPPGTAAVIGNGVKFDPRLESPSIRKTPGIDHTTSKPVARDLHHVDPKKQDESPHQQSNINMNKHGPGPIAPAPAHRPSLGNVVNPSLNHTRQIGAPGMGSPMANRGQYRPPTMKRPASAAVDARAPLNEVSTNGVVSAAGGVDAKRQKTG